MKKFALLTLLATALSLSSAFATTVETDVDFDALISADEMTETMTTMDWDHDPGRNPGHGYRHFVCYAKNRRGMTFQGFGRTPREAQEDAVRQCYSRGSRFCQAAGCSRSH